MIDLAHAPKYEVTALENDLVLRGDQLVALRWVLSENNKEVDSLLSQREQFDPVAIDAAVVRLQESSHTTAWEIVQQEKEMATIQTIVDTKKAR